MKTIQRSLNKKNITNFTKFTLSQWQNIYVTDLNFKFVNSPQQLLSFLTLSNNLYLTEMKKYGFFLSPEKIQLLKDKLTIIDDHETSINDFEITIDDILGKIFGTAYDNQFKEELFNASINELSNSNHSDLSKTDSLNNNDFIDYPEENLSLQPIYKSLKKSSSSPNLNSTSFIQNNKITRNFSIEKINNKNVITQDNIKNIKKYITENIKIGGSVTDHFKAFVKNGIYVDKTKFIKEIIELNYPTFISTPQRWGKSLNLSMLKDFLHPDANNIKRFDKKGQYSFNEGSNDTSYPGANNNLKYFKKTDIFNETTKKEILDNDGNKTLNNVNIVKEYQGQYPVIYLNFKDCGNTNIKDIKSSIRSAISKTYKDHKYLHTWLQEKVQNNDLDAQDNLAKFKGYYLNHKFYNQSNGDKVDLKLEESILFLSCQLKEFFGRKSYILVDEYDKPTHKLLLDNILDESLDFRAKSNLQEIAQLTSKIVGTDAKGTDSPIKNIILTGILNTVDKDVSSVFNALKHLTLSHKKLTDYFGFSDTELKQQVLSKIFTNNFEKNEKELYDKLFEQMKQWYNGYNFSGQDLFNPFAVMHCINNLKNEVDPKLIFTQYWNSSLGTNILHLIFKSELLKNEHHFKQNIINIDAEIKLDINEGKTLYELVKNTDTKSVESMKTLLSTLLVRYGYFTKVNDSDKYKVTSKELALRIKSELEEYITNQYSININDFLPTFNKVFQFSSNVEIKNNLKDFCIQLENKISNNYKTEDNKIGKIDKINEHLLHDIIACITLSSDLTKAIHSDSGKDLTKGRTDITCEINNKNLGIIIELKYNKSVEIALEQIKDREYFERFNVNQEIKQILGIGINISDKNEDITIESDYIEYYLNNNDWELVD